MSYVSDIEVMGGIGFGDDHFDGLYASEGLETSGYYNYGKPLTPYSPIQNEPMGRSYNPNNFNSSNPKVGNNYKYSPLSTYDLDTDEIYSNHMYGNPSFYKERDAQYGASTPNPSRNSFNVEQDFMQDSVDYQAPGFKSTAKRIYNKAGELISGNAWKKKPIIAEHLNSDTSTTTGGINFWIIFIIIMAIAIAVLIKQNRDLTDTLKSIALHGIMNK
jgi:hypothetical protein